ncbi:hypothetical protein I7I53_07831 [Histoplasma capsulatum var. duboisii H88]|uniref:Uncharacterized protein n=1 Tax=Ajellomyces capsulatus (strain H88) TaxID=544711 RepID=A0A8A1LK99_AJEC8|nr:hypothetical protein I7I53_07831 [Histoplasma capsulatum var. duboisii H88]
MVPCAVKYAPWNECFHTLIGGDGFGDERQQSQARNDRTKSLVDWLCYMSYTCIALHVSKN